MNKKIELENVKPMDIEHRSFEIISEELAEAGKVLAPETEMIVKRCIHTSADFDYADNLYFSKDAVSGAIEALKNGACIVTDTQMAWSGINKRLLGKLGGEAFCFMSDPDVAEEAKRRGVTRAIVCMERGARLQQEGRRVIFAIGNAPTALVRLYELIENHELESELIIGVPVGFVNVVPSKEMIIESGTRCIVARGRKGGSNIAAAICNALLYQISSDRGY